MHSTLTRLPRLHYTKPKSRAAIMTITFMSSHDKSLIYRCQRSVATGRLAKRGTDQCVWEAS